MISASHSPVGPVPSPGGPHALHSVDPVISPNAPEGPRRRVGARGLQSGSYISAFVALSFGLLTDLGPNACAEVVVLRPVADTTLIEVAPSNNLGGLAFVNSGTTQNFTRNRGLFRFDLMGSVPAGSWVSNAALTVEVVGQSVDGFTAAEFGVYRMLRAWGEGTKVGDSAHPGLGAPATVNEATWTAPFAFTTNTWTQAGGAAGTDFVATASAQNTIYGINDSPYDFGSTPALIADVQAWVDQPSGNFGWMLACLSEDNAFTARRFGSREDSLHPPLLRIEFVPPPSLISPALSGENFTFQLVSRPREGGSVEFKNDFADGGAWTTLTNLPPTPAETHYTIADPITNAHRFYRLKIPQ